MKQFLLFITVLISFNSFSQTDEQLGLKSGLVFNQIGYTKGNQKTILLLDKNLSISNYTFSVIDRNGEVILAGYTTFEKNEWRRNIYSIDISSITKEGVYTVKSAGYSEQITISDDIIPDLQLNDIFRELFARQKLPVEILPILQRNGPDEYLNTGYTLQKRGGWKDAFSTDQHIFHAKIVLQLLTAYEENNNLFISDITNGVPNILHEAKWGVDFLLSMQEHTGCFHTTILGGPYNPSQPERGVVSDSSSFLNLKSCAALAQASRVLRIFFPEFADTCLRAAENGWNWYIENPDVYSNQPKYWNARYDSRLLAAFEMWNATNNEIYKTILDNGILSGELKANPVKPWEAWWNSNAGPLEYYDWDGWFGMEDLLLNSNLLMVYAKYYRNAPKAIQTIILNQASFILDWLDKNTRTPYNFYDIFLVDYFGMCGDAINAAANLLHLGLAINDQKLVNYGLDHLDFVLGKNPVGKSFVSEIGTDLHKNLWRPETDTLKGAIVAGIYKINNLPTNNSSLTGDLNALGWKCDELVTKNTSSFLLSLCLIDKDVRYPATRIQENNIGNNSSVLIFPNPANSKCTVFSIAEDIKEIEVLSIAGQTLFREEVNAKEIEINFDNSTSGIHVIRIIFRTGIITRKIIIN